MANVSRFVMIRVGKFLSGGLLNTAVSYGVYVFLHYVISYQIAFFISYCVGIVFSYCFNSLIVFHVALSWRGLFSYPLVYLVQYAVSACCMGVLVERLHLSTVYSPLLTSLITLPITYALSKVLIGRLAEKCAHAMTSQDSK